jgi:hypothetical protein
MRRWVLPHDSLLDEPAAEVISGGEFFRTKNSRRARGAAQAAKVVGTTSGYLLVRAACMRPGTEQFTQHGKWLILSDGNVEPQDVGNQEESRLRRLCRLYTRSEWYGLLSPHRPAIGGARPSSICHVPL